MSDLRFVDCGEAEAMRLDFEPVESTISSPLIQEIATAILC